MIMNDSWIKKMALEHAMIVPFKDKQISEGKISSGLSSYGYDATLSDTFKLFTNVHAGIVDVKNFDDSNFIEKKAKEVLLPGNSFLLGATEEIFSLPRDVIAICVGKSSWARAGIIVNVTPIEPEFTGQITIEISNTSQNTCKIYAHEGIAQFLFFKGNAEPEISYKDRNGKYQGQRGVVGPRVLSKK